MSSVLQRKWAFISFHVCSFPRGVIERFSLGKNISLNFIHFVLWLIAFPYNHTKNWYCFRKQHSTSLVSCLSFLKQSELLTLSVLCIFWRNRGIQAINCFRLYDWYWGSLNRMLCETTGSDSEFTKVQQSSLLAVLSEISDWNFASRSDTLTLVQLDDSGYSKQGENHGATEDPRRFRGINFSVHLVACTLIAGTDFPQLLSVDHGWACPFDWQH